MDTPGLLYLSLVAGSLPKHFLYPRNNLITHTRIFTLLLFSTFFFVRLK
jgi:hypothetical protein